MKPIAMISQPMKGKTEKQIRTEREKTIELLQKRGYTVIDTVFDSYADEGNLPVKCLGRSIEALAEADLVYFMHGWEDARGCRIEHLICGQYGVNFEEAIK